MFIRTGKGCTTVMRSQRSIHIGVVKVKKKKTKTHHVTCDSRVRKVKLESCSDGRMVPGALSLTGVVHLMVLNGES